MGKDIEARHNSVRERNRTNIIFLECTGPGKELVCFWTMLRSLASHCSHWGPLNILRQDGSPDLYFTWDQFGGYEQGRFKAGEPIKRQLQ